jgi:hypothetical protein
VADLLVTQRIYPTRGIVVLNNARGARISIVDAKRWIWLNRVVYRADKVDVLVAGAVPGVLPELIEHASTLDLMLSLRLDCTTPPPDLDGLKQAGLFDVFLCPPSPDTAHLDFWLDGCASAGLPMRLQLQAPFPAAFDVTGLVTRIVGAGVMAVNLSLRDPFCDRPPCGDKARSQAALDQMNDLAAGLGDAELEVNLVRIPFCLVRPENRRYVVNAPQFFLDHQQYRRAPYELAVDLYRRGPVAIGIVLQILLAKRMRFLTPFDRKLLPWVLHHPAVNARLALWRWLTRHRSFFRSVPKEIEESAAAYEREVVRQRARIARDLGPACSRCRLWKICDHDTPERHRILPGIPVRPEDGDLVVYPLHFSAEQPKYYDRVDRDRVRLETDAEELAETARRIVLDAAAATSVLPESYGVENTYFEHMESGVRWFSVSNTEKVSSPLADLQPPFTLAVSFGGGLADYIGFGFGGKARVLCSTDSYQHDLVLHVAGDGRYVLLRDGRPVRPVAFESDYYAPLRLGDRVQPRIAIWNIDGWITTQQVLVWRGRESTHDGTQIKYSVIIVCTRYARRLQAALASIAHQQGFPVERIEVIVCYVPGADATEDVLDSVRRLYPGLRIVRNPYAEQHKNSKGFMLNEARESAAGEWIMFLDADIVLPPELFAKIEGVSDAAHFVVPDGRKMLTPDTTAAILMGEIRPWECWADLLNGPGEYRKREAKGVPIGFCQCVRASCTKSVQYREFGHFEYADMYFSEDIRDVFGPETWLTGTPVLHLDHGGSQWYGAQKHR